MIKRDRSKKINDETRLYSGNRPSQNYFRHQSTKNKKDEILNFNPFKF